MKALLTVFVLLVCAVSLASCVVIPTTTIAANSWQYYSLSVSTAPKTTFLVRAVLTFTLSTTTPTVQIYAQYNGNPTQTSNLALNQTANSGGVYFAAVVSLPLLSTVNFGIFNPTSSPVTILNGLYYFGQEQDLPNPFTLPPPTGSYTVNAGTATFFVVTVPEATQQALYFSLTFTDTGAFPSTNLLVGRGSIPYNPNNNAWTVSDFEVNLGTNPQGQTLGGWNCWYITGLVSGEYYISLYNPDSTNHVVSVTTYLTEIFALDVNRPFPVAVNAGKYTLLNYFSDPSGRPYLEIKVAAPAGQIPAVYLQQGFAPTLRQSQSFLSSSVSGNTVTYYAAVGILSHYYMTLLNTNSNGTYNARVTIQQTSVPPGPPSNNNNIVTSDTYGDGVEPIEVAGIVMGVFIGIFSLFFLACFLLSLLQMDRNYWYNSDSLTSDDL